MDLHKIVELGNRTFEELSPEEKLRLEHQRIHEQHKGHEKMHAEMIIVLIITLVVAQLCLIEWKKRHYRSYSVSYHRIKKIEKMCRKNYTEQYCAQYE
ncbi:E3 ubiquitin ligase Rnf121-like [Diabrotica undecimpunctata]|uniref:E3 ubiquitin ligase Rnf121-like n=1 Tax=Diabrotica undecimpunctata TaxID=50387 RepID=UPI003B63A519